ncbi:hypothetical protein AOLI_G00298230 [Acnodon oligacanthus]
MAAPSLPSSPGFIAAWCSGPALRPALAATIGARGVHLQGPPESRPAEQNKKHLKEVLPSASVAIITQPRLQRPQ